MCSPTGSHHLACDCRESALAARIGELEEALAPFAAVGEQFIGDPLAEADGVWLWKRQSNVREEPGITISDCLAARSALAGKEKTT